MKGDNKEGKELTIGSERAERLTAQLPALGIEPEAQTYHFHVLRFTSYGKPE